MSTEKRLQNLYIARLVTNEKPCFVCNKFTNVVLTSADGSSADWFYTCRSHLGDFNFCTKLGATSPKSVARQKQQQQQEKKEASLADRPPESDSITELVSSIGSAWKSWRASKKPEDKDEQKKEDNEKKEDNKTEKDDASSSTPSPTASSSASLPASPAVPSPQQPVRFVIQRDYFYLRQREYMKKLQKKQAAEKLKTLQFPDVPKTMPLNKDTTTQN